MNILPINQRLMHWFCCACMAIAFLVAFDSPLMAKPFPTGLVPEDPEVLAALPKVPHFRAFLPSKMDLSERLPPVRSQGSQGSCTAWATGYYLRSYYQIIQGNEALVPFSPAYVFNQIKLGEGCDQGSRISDALILMKEHGAIPWEVFPYSDQSCDQTPNKSLQDQASRYKIKDFKRLNERNIDDIRGALAQGNPVVFGMTVDDAFQYEKGEMPLTRTIDCETCGGHAMTLVGYDDARSAFRVVNSWGTDWGDQGFFWLGYDAFVANTHAAMRIDAGFDPLQAVNAVNKKEEPEPVPVPAPEPTPVPVPTPVPEPTPKPPVLDQSAVAQQLASFNCAMLDASYPEDGTVAIHGFVATASDQQRLQQLSTLTGVLKLSLDVDLRPWPQCEALQTFDAALAVDHGLQVQVVDDRQPAQLTEGDYLVLDVTTPDFPAYIYVTYLQAGGDAIHLHRPFWLDSPTAANSKMRLGLDLKKVRFKIQAPFGNEMIMVIASQHPLFEQQQAVVEEEREYLTAFRRSILHLQRNFPQQKLAARFVDLITRSKE